ncbi:MAG: hypothetical protein AAF841_13885 [Pseudomonadota bacterium]
MTGLHGIEQAFSVPERRAPRAKPIATQLSRKSGTGGSYGGP